MVVTAAGSISVFTRGWTSPTPSPELTAGISTGMVENMMFGCRANHNLTLQAWIVGTLLLR